VLIKHANDQLTKSRQANTHTHKTCKQQSNAKKYDKKGNEYWKLRNCYAYNWIKSLIVLLNKSTLANIKCD